MFAGVKNYPLAANFGMTVKLHEQFHRRNFKRTSWYTFVVFKRFNTSQSKQQ